MIGMVNDMTEYNLTNLGHNNIGDPHQQYDFNEVYTSKYSNSLINSRVKILDIDLLSDVTGLLSSDYYGFKGVKRINLEFDLTGTVNENTNVIGKVLLSAFVRKGTNDNISFSDADNFRAYASVDWKIGSDYRTPTAVDPRLFLTMIAKKDSSYIDKDGISKYNISFYSSLQQYGSVSVIPKYITFQQSTKVENGITGVAWHTTNPFNNPQSNTKDKFNWIFKDIRTNNLITEADFKTLLTDTNNVQIPIIDQRGVTLMDSYSSVDVKKITSILHLPIGGRYSVELRNCPIVNGPESGGQKWAFVDIMYTGAQRTITIYFNTNNAYRITGNGYNSGTWSSWKQI